MRRGGCIVVVPSHATDCPDVPQAVGIWTYHGFGVLRVFEVRVCPACGFVDDSHLLREWERREPMARDEVIAMQRAERARRDALIALSHERLAAERCGPE
jgi:hypothetical protein